MSSEEGDSQKEGIFREKVEEMWILVHWVACGVVWKKKLTGVETYGSETTANGK